jgi:hypothetical protein
MSQRHRLDEEQQTANRATTMITKIPQRKELIVQEVIQCQVAEGRNQMQAERDSSSAAATVER